MPTFMRLNHRVARKSDTDQSESAETLDHQLHKQRYQYAMISWTNATHVFCQQNVFQSPQIYIGYTLLGIFASLLLLSLYSFSRAPRYYCAKYAWIWALTYFNGCIAVSWPAGVFEAVFIHPATILPEDPVFDSYTFCGFFIVFLGYWVIWRRGTVVYGRKLNLPFAILFGIVHGIAEGLLILSIWALVELSSLPRWSTGAIVIVIHEIFKYARDKLFWNKKVTPAHNIIQWNSWKVLLVYLPVSLITVTFFMSYEVAWLFVCMHILAMLGSSIIMRFPSPFSVYYNPPPGLLINRLEDRNIAEWGTPREFYKPLLVTEDKTEPVSHQ